MNRSLRSEFEVRHTRLPEGAKTDQVKAELKEGVLKISIPVPESAKKTRQVTVTS